MAAKLKEGKKLLQRSQDTSAFVVPSAAIARALSSTFIVSTVLTEGPVLTVVKCYTLCGTIVTFSIIRNQQSLRLTVMAINPPPSSLFISFYFRASVNKDGNCLLRAVAFHTLGDEDKHDAIHTRLVRFKKPCRFVPNDNVNDERGKFPKPTSYLDHMKLAR